MVQRRRCGFGAALTRPLGLADELGILLVLVEMVALVLTQHHLQVDVIAGLVLPQVAVGLLVQGQRCGHVAGEGERRGQVKRRRRRLIRQHAASCSPLFQQVLVDEDEEAPFPHLSPSLILWDANTDSSARPA